MRAVIDTNVLLSALLWSGTPRSLLEQVRNGTVALISSPALLAELARVIDGPSLMSFFCAPIRHARRHWQRCGNLQK